jgi:mannose-6-phosphate isomerase-like protein (cupin superfamily)
MNVPDVYRVEGSVAALLRDGTSHVQATRPGPPERWDGLSVGVIEHLTGPSPHRGEVHPDGDELLYMISGRVEVILDDGDRDHVGAETVRSIGPGEALIVPRGVWHRVEVVEPGHFVHVTPGPNGDYRPL